MRLHLAGSLLGCVIATSLSLVSCGDDASSSWSPTRDGGDASPDAQAADAPSDAAAEHATNESGADGLSEAASEAGVDASAPEGPALYPGDRTQSPITPWVVARMQEILDRDPTSRRDVFMKVGDSITYSDAFLDCFAGSNVDLDSHGSLQPAIDLYKNATVQGTSSFDRTSLCVEIGRTAYWAMTGTPPPVEKEMTATHASVAVTMYGSNDIGWFGADHVGTLKWYHEHMLDLVDKLIDAGIIPILSTIPPRDDDASHDAWVPTLNAVVRAVAQGRQIPLVDFHRELLPLAEHGLGGDNLHPNSYAQGACKLTPAGLGYGYNVRNLLTLEALDRVRKSVLASQGALDTDAPMLAGDGTASSPFLIVGNPFTDLRDTSKSKSKTLGTYSGCSSNADESGPEYLYKLQVTKASRVRAMVLDRGDVDVDIHLLDANANEAGCISRGDTMVEADLAPGTYHFSLDSFASSGVEHSGEFLFVMLLCDPGDPACTS
ncbi:MAG: SGNH/GDSL hydrolase family protein [Deltaproteobacteria bacterium]|nr:SGNH/GDSL hydrolase family protein [Deltaproteobacteria bacterium]